MLAYYGYMTRKALISSFQTSSCTIAQGALLILIYYLHLFLQSTNDYNKDANNTHLIKIKHMIHPNTKKNLNMLNLLNM